MRVLLSTIGSRGEVQPLLALASRLRELGLEVRVCVPPDFCDWIEGLGIPVVPIGPEVRPTAAPGGAGGLGRLSPEQRRQLIEGTVATQFATIPNAARGCDVVVGCGALQVAAPSVTELLGIGYVHVHYCPITLPSPHHAPPRLPGWPLDERASNRELWAMDAQRWNDSWGAALNSHRASAGLGPVDDVRGHIFTERPWLAADPALGPWPEPEDQGVFQTGAWILPDERPLSAELEAFLEAGEPPLYFGLGSMGAPADEGRDCILIGETNHQALFPRVAAVVHHGGAGTTTATARAGAVQVVIPQRYDQPYWAQRVGQLGIGVAHPQGMPTADSLATALRDALKPDVAARARSLAGTVRGDGVQAAAERLMGSV